MDDFERRLRTTNLNLLPVLRAVLRHRNLTTAAAELNITQSGVSNSLRQLREHFGDPLLVRHGRALRLSEKGKQLIEPLERALAAVGAVLASPSFDPATTSRRFTVATADYVAAVIAPPMAAILGREAPQATLQMVTAHRRSARDLAEGEIDMVISPRQIFEAAIYDAPALASQFALEPLMREPFVCIGRQDDEIFTGEITAERYLARAHASFHLDLVAHASLEHGYLLEHEVDQFNRILTSDFTILPLIAAQSDCLALVPRSLGRLAVRTLPLRMAASPLPIADLELVMAFARGRRDDPELAWFRALLKRCAAETQA